MKLSIWPKPSHDWSDILRIAQHAEQRGWHGVWFADHFMPAGQDNSGPIQECWAVLAALAATVPRLRVGALVCGNTYRHPAVLAKTATTADIISGGRVVLGLGGGWQANEHTAYGIHFGSTRERLDRLEEACEILNGLRRNQRTTFEGSHYRLEDAPLEPKPAGPLPLLVGGGGEQRTIPIAARHADEWNVWGTPDVFAHKAGVLDRACEDAGRDSAVLRSTQALMALDVPGLPVRKAPSSRRAAVEGGVEQVRDTFGRYSEAGVNEFILPDFNFADADETIAVIDFLNEHVRPGL